MNHLMRTLISWSNLTKAKSTSGQIATLLILALILLLVFVLVTMNLGDVAVKSTTISNAADSASLALASSLCTKAKMIFDGLGHKMAKCKSRGFLSMLLAIIVAIVAIVVSILVPGGFLAVFLVQHLGTTWGLAALGAMGGAVGGATGAAIQGTSIFMGAITGAGMGAAIGTLAAGLGVGLSTGLSGTAAATEGATAVISTAWPIVPKLVIGGALGVAGDIGGDVGQYMGSSDLMSQLQKNLGKMDEKDQFREGAVFTALSQVVDDPNKHADDDDINANGDRTELIPRFVWWYNHRIKIFLQLGAEQVAPVNNFVAATAAFRDYIFQYGYAGDGTTPGYLERQDYKWSLDANTEETAYPGPNTGGANGPVVDGSIVGLLRPLYNLGYSTGTWTWNGVSVPSWLPGPTADQMNNWLGEDCSGSGDCSSGTCTSTTCTPPSSGYDGLDRVADDLRDMVQFMDGIAPPTFNVWINHMLENVNVGLDSATLNDLQTQYSGTMANLNPSQSWQSWMNMFYNSDNPSDPTAYYNTLQTYIGYLTNLRNQLIHIRDNMLPVCNEGNYDATGTCVACIPGAGQWQWWWINGGYTQQFVNDCGGCVFNTPCSFRTSQNHPHDTGTIDTTGNDVFLPALAAIDDLINHMSAYRDTIKQFSDMVNSYMTNIDADFGGLNPVRYAWDDMRGHNEVWVRVGPFLMPQLKKYKTGNWLVGKVCNGLVHSTDENNCWVKVTRNSPSPNMGALGRWNPFNRGVNKISYAYFDGGRDDPQVGIKATR